MRCGLKKDCLLLVFLAVFMVWSLSVAHAAADPNDLKVFDMQVKTWAEECRDAIEVKVEQAIRAGKLTQAQCFDTFYIPMPNTYPQKYHTQYDTFMDTNIQRLLDGYLIKSDRLLYVIAVDKNGYVPTHNSKYSQKLTGNKELDTKINRTKTIFTDRTGLTAAKNTEPYLLQKYNRDTGETAYDISVPIFINGKHWGCVRIGYN